MVRIRSLASQLGVVVAGVILVVLSGLAWGLYDFGAGYLAATVATIVLVIVAARIFRGPTEPDRPRAWWVLTASPVTGYTWGLLFALQAVTGAVAAATGDAPAVVWVGVAVGVVIAAAYVHSAARSSPSHAHVDT